MEFIVYSTLAEIKVDSNTGEVISIINKASDSQQGNFKQEIEQIKGFDMPDFFQRHNDYNLHRGVDILRLNYWMKNGKYERHAHGY